VDCLLVLVQASSYTVFCRSETPIFTVEVIKCSGDWILESDAIDTYLQTRDRRMAHSPNPRLSGSWEATEDEVE
ncbi:unnamed protein product, partial [Nesidiocoris tenuis]